MHVGLSPVRDDVTVAIMGTQTKGNIFYTTEIFSKEKWNFYVREHSLQPPGTLLADFLYFEKRKRKHLKYKQNKTKKPVIISDRL